MSAHDVTDLSPDGTPWKLRGFRPNQYRRFFGARLRKFRDVQDCILYICMDLHRLGAAGVSRDHFGGTL